MKTIGLPQMVEELNLKNLTPDIDMYGAKITVSRLTVPLFSLPDILNILQTSVCRSSDM